MANDKDIEIIVGADIPKSTVQIEADLKKIKTEPLNVPVNIEINQKKLDQMKSVLLKQMEILQTQANKANINLNVNGNQTKFNDLISTNNFENMKDAGYNLKMMRLEYQKLNAEMTKDIPQNALESMNKKLANMPSSISRVETSFRSLKNPTQEIEQQVTQLKTLFNDVGKANTNEEKIQAFNKLRDSIVLTSNEMKALKAVESQTAKQNSTANSIEQIGLKAQIGANRVRAFGNQLNSTAKGKYANELKSLENVFKNIGSKEDLTKANIQLREFETRMKSMGNVGNTVFDKLKKNIGQFFSFIGAASISMTVINSLRKAVSNLVELDKSLTDLRIATNGTYEETAKLLSSYTKLGKQLGATTKEVASSADSWLRQNKTLAETNTLVKDSTVLSKLGQIDSADSTKYLTSVTKGYNVAVKDTIGIVDKLTSVDAISATSAGGLAEGISKVSNLANMSGVSIDKLLGYLAIVGETTQKEMSEVGNSFNLGTVAA